MESDNEYQIFGDESDAATYGGLVSSLFKTAGGVATQAEASKKAKAKAEADKASSADRDAAISAAKSARKNADEKAIEARVARQKASTESDPNGPLHKAAAEAERLAVLYDADAKGFEAKAGLMSSTAGAAGGPSGGLMDHHESFWTKHYRGIPGWGWTIGTVAIGGGLIALIQHLLKGRQQ